MSTAAHEAALKALQEAEAALAAAEQDEAAEPPIVAPAPPEVPVAPAPPDPIDHMVHFTAKAKYFDQGSQYLGPCAVNGT